MSDDNTATTRTRKRRTIRRVQVYAGTIVAMLAMVGGFALAAWTLGTVTSNQGGYTTSLSGTIWAAETTGNPALTSAPVPAADAPCVTTASFAPTAGATTAAAAASVGVATGNTCTANDVGEKFTFAISVTTSLCTTACSDTFYFYSTSSAATGQQAQSVTVSVTSESGTGSVAYTATLTAYVDYGATAPSSITVLQVVVAGS